LDKEDQQGMEKSGIQASAEKWICISGISACVIGSFYVPTVPWYMLGEVKEAEIGLWGMLTVLGGLLCVVGAETIKRTTAKSLQQGLLVIACLGMAALLLSQLPAFLMWQMYDGSFTREWAPNETAGWLAGLSLHTWLAVSGVIALLASLKALLARTSALQLTGKQGSRTVGVLLFCGALWVVWNLYEEQTWVAFTHPVQEARGVSRDVTVSAGWRGARGNIGIRVRYADEPERYIPGVSGASMTGVSFKPDQPFEPGRRLKVTVEAGMRSHVFYFYTAD
jgi:hypothetical protein